MLRDVTGTRDVALRLQVSDGLQCCFLEGCGGHCIQLCLPVSWFEMFLVIATTVYESYGTVMSMSQLSTTSTYPLPVCGFAF